jgi:hypothetical protein
MFALELDTTSMQYVSEAIALIADKKIAIGRVIAIGPGGGNPSFTVFSEDKAALEAFAKDFYQDGESYSEMICEETSVF